MKNAEESLPIYGRNPRRSLVYIPIQLVHSVIYACCVVRVAVVAILIVVVIIVDGIVAIIIGIIRLVGFFAAGARTAVRRFGAVRSAALGGRFGRAMYPAVGRALIRFSRAAVLDAGVFMLCARAAAGRSGAAAGDDGIALRGFMYLAIGGALSRFSGAAALDAAILGSECADTQNAGSQRNEHCAKNAFPNSLFHGLEHTIRYKKNVPINAEVETELKECADSSREWDGKMEHLLHIIT